MNILIIKDDKPGHYNQTEGLKIALKELYEDAKFEYIEVEIKSKISRKLLRFLLNSASLYFESEKSLKYLAKFYKKFSLPKEKPDLIISTGGNTANLNAWFSKVYKSKNILNGALRGLNEQNFTYVTTVIDLGYKNQIIIDVAPSIITSKKVEDASSTFKKDNRLNDTYFTLLIGGDGAGYKYDENFYETLVEYVIDISKQKSVKWLITTSRRTPKKMEELLKNRLKEHCSYFVAYNEKPEKVMLSFLGLGEAIFVTEESSSMISEAISIQKPVFTLHGKNSNPDDNYNQILNKFVNNRWIKRVNIVTKKDWSIEQNQFDVMKEDAYLMLSKKLKPYLLEKS